ncbi:MAG: AsmA family protein, partial [Pseudomonadota bacterium]
IDARVEAGGPSGPFKADGSLAVAGTHLTFSGAVDRVGERRGSPARLAVQVLEADARAEFSGVFGMPPGGPTLRGKLALSAADLRRLAAVLGVPEAPLPAGAALKAEAAVTADGDQVAISDLTAMLGEARASGAITIGLGEVPKVDARLALASLNLDSWLGTVPAPNAAPPTALPPPPPAANTLPGAGPAQAPPPPFTLPRDLFFDLAVAVEALSWRGAVIENARVEATLAEGELVLNGATAQLPGGSVVSLAGVLAPVEGRPVFDGQAEARSDNLRVLLAWLGADVAAVPPGRLLRLDASTDLRAAWPELEARKLDMRVDSTHATGGLTARLGERPAYGARLTIDAFNLDHYLPGEASSAGSAPDQPPTPQPPRPQPAQPAKEGPPLAALTGFDADLALTVGQLTMNGVAADDVRLAALLDDGTLTISQAAARLAGSRITAGGRLLGLATATPRAENLTLAVDSPQPARLFRFLGIEAPVDRMGALAASARIDGDWTSMDLRARAETGGVTAAAEGTLASPLASPRAKLRLSVEADSFGRLVRLFSPTYRPAGTVGALAVTATADISPQAVTLPDLAASAGPARLAGELRIALEGPVPVVTGTLAGNAIDLGPFLPAERTGLLVPGSPRLPPVLAPARPEIVPTATAGTNPWSREPLELGWTRAFGANVALSAESLAWDGWTLAAPKATVLVDRGTAAVDSLTGRLLGGDLKASARLASGGTPSLTGTLAIAGANLSQAELGAGGIAVTQGRLDAQAEFAAAGRSSHDMAQALDGKGGLTVTDGVVKGFDLPAVGRQLQNIENIGSVLGLLNAGLTGGTTKFSRLAGTFVAEDGMVSSRDLRLDAEGGSATAEAVVRLPPWTMDAAIAFQLAGSSAPPAVVRLEGPIGNPRKVVDINALQQFLVARGLGRALGGKDAGKLIEGLLGGRRQQQQPQQAQPQPGQQAQPPAKPDAGRLIQDLLKGLGR